MPVYSETDDSDAWRDDESMTSTDFSSHTGDLESMEDSDYEFLSGSSGRAYTEEDEREDTDNDDSASLRTTDAATSVITGISSGDTRSVISSEESAEDHPDTVLHSTELPRVMRDSQEMEDSTTTITPVSPLQRRDTVTQSPSTSRPVTNGLPFNILFVGSHILKSNVLRKLGQALMAATLRERASDQTTPSPVNTDWSSGYTSVVPITDFNSSDTAPEVEFIEDSLVKMKVQEIDSLQGYTGRRVSQFMCQIDQNTRAISCYHRTRGNRALCPWITNPEASPSLLVYCSGVRGEKIGVNTQKVEEFAQLHHIPLLTITESETSFKRFNYTWNQGNAPVAEPNDGESMMLGYEPLTPAKFFELDSLQLGISLWKNAAASKDIIKSSRKELYKLNFQKHVMLRIAIAILVALFFLFSKVPFSFKKALPFETPYSVANAPTEMDMETKYVAASDLMSIHPSTVTVTEQLTVTVPIVHTKTVTTSTTVTPRSHAPQKPTSTLLLHAIAASVNVPRANLPARQLDTDYGYTFGYDDNTVQIFLETERSVLLRLPKAYRESTTGRPKVKIAVTRDGKPVQFELREWKKNDLAFISWAPEEMHDHLEVKAWTESTPIILAQVVIDYTEPIIDPRLWEILEKSQQAARKKMYKIGGTLDSKFKIFAKEVQSRVADPANYVAVEETMLKYMRYAKKFQDDVREAAERNFRDVKIKYPQFFQKPMLSEDGVKRFTEVKDRFQKQFDKYVRHAQKNARRLSMDMKEKFAKSVGKKDSWKDVKDWPMKYWKGMKNEERCRGPFKMLCRKW